MELDRGLLLATLLGFALTSNIPLGFLRAGARKYSLRWFLYIHLSIPFIAVFRIVEDFSWQVIPLTVAFAISGQLLGGFLYRRRGG